MAGQGETSPIGCSNETEIYSARLCALRNLTTINYKRPSGKKTAPMMMVMMMMTRMTVNKKNLNICFICDTGTGEARCA